MTLIFKLQCTGFGYIILEANVRALTAAELDIGIRVLKNGKAPGLDDIQTELIKQTQGTRLATSLFNNCTETKEIPKLCRQAKVVALLKPGKDPSVAKSFQPITLLCHTYKLFEQLILNRIAEHVDAKLIPEQTGFRPGKSCTSQLLNLTKHIEDGYEKCLITGAVFVDASSAYDTVNHQRLLSKVLEMTGDVHLTDLIRIMQESRRFFVVLIHGREEEPLATTTKGTTTGKCTGTDVVQHLHQQPAHTQRHARLHLRRRLVHRVARKRLQQHRSVTHVCPEHYDYLLRHDPTACEPFKNIDVCFPPNEERSKRELIVVWNGTRLSNTTTPVYLGSHLGRTLCYKTHTEKTNMKVNARNNIIPKLANSKWGCMASNSDPAVSSSATQLPNTPVLCGHAHKLNPALHDCCRIISGCLKPTNLDSVHLLAGIAPRHIWMTVACRMEHRGDWG